MMHTIELYGGKQGLWFEVHGDKAGFVRYNEPRVQGIIQRQSNKPFGPKIVTYRGKRYPVRGGIRGPLFITVS